MGEHIIIFILGCDRSGTHLLAKTLETSPEIAAHATTSPNGDRWYEPEETFQLSIAMARNPGRVYALYKRLVDEYVRRWPRAERYWVVKDHPNTWIAEKLAHEFPHARFISIERDPRAVVASMLRHYGVMLDLAWSLAYPVPCPFMGIAAESWHQLSTEEKLAYKWRAHYDELARLKGKLGDRLYQLTFEELVKDAESTCVQLGAWLDIGIPTPRTYASRLDAWKRQLSQEQVDLIQDIAWG